MPNGESRNWIRFCGAIDGFRCWYKRWPEAVKVPEFFPDELEEKLSEEDQLLLAEKIHIIGDGSSYIAMDESGNSYSYGHEGFSNDKPDIRAQDWLGIMPDYYD